MGLYLLVGTSGCRTTGGSPEETLARAREHLAARETDEALPLLDALARRSPEDLSLARERAAAYVQAGKGDTLLAQLDAGGESPEYVRAYVRGLVLFTRASESGKAVAELERAASLRPELAELHHRLGLARVELEQYALALPSLQRALELEPTLGQAYLPLAKALQRTDRPDDAIAALRQWVAAGPDAKGLPAARALMDAIADPFAGLPRAAEQRLEQGIFWLEKADVPQEALAALDDILREYPDLAVVHALVGLCHQRLDDAGRALDAFKRAIELGPRQGKLHFYVGELYLSRQRPEQAREAFERAVALHPLLDVAYARLGELALARRELPAAAAAFRTWSQLSPESGAPRLQLALVQQLQGDLRGAEANLLAVLAREPSSLETQLRLGLLYVELGRKADTADARARATAEARRWLEAVLEAQPENVVASRALESLAPR